MKQINCAQFDSCTCICLHFYNASVCLSLQLQGKWSKLLFVRDIKIEKFVPVFLRMKTKRILFYYFSATLLISLIIQTHFIWVCC